MAGTKVQALVLWLGRAAVYIREDPSYSRPENIIATERLSFVIRIGSYWAAYSKVPNRSFAALVANVFVGRAFC